MVQHLNFVRSQKRRDDFVDREKLILLVTFRGRSLLALDNTIHGLLNIPLRLAVIPLLQLFEEECVG
jgi:hypothetical protein